MPLSATPTIPSQEYSEVNMRILVCQHLTDVSNSFKSSKLKENLELHQKKMTQELRKHFEPKFLEHIVIEQTTEDII